MFSLSRLICSEWIPAFFNLYDKSWPNKWVNCGEIDPFRKISCGIGIRFFNLYDKSPETLWELRSIRASQFSSRINIEPRAASRDWFRKDGNPLIEGCGGRRRMRGRLDAVERDGVQRQRASIVGWKKEWFILGIKSSILFREPVSLNVTRSWLTAADNKQSHCGIAIIAGSLGPVAWFIQQTELSFSFSH